MSGFLLFQWFAKLSAENKLKVMKEVAPLLKTDLETKCYKEISFSGIKEGIEDSIINANKGKIYLYPGK